MDGVTYIDTDSPRAVATSIVLRRGIVAHEASHAAATVLAGMVPAEIKASPRSGYVRMDWSDFELDAESARAMAKAALAGPIGGDDRLPLWPIMGSLSADERALAALIKFAGVDSKDDYRRLVAETYELATTPEFRDLERLFTVALDRYPSLDADQIRVLLGPGRLAKYIQKESSTMPKLEYKTLSTTWLIPDERPQADFVMPSEAQIRRRAKALEVEQKASRPVTVARFEC